jgi:hypothetical protein
MPDWSVLIKSAGPASGAFALIALGIYGGQYAAKFKTPFDDCASFGCLSLMVIGALIAIPQIGVTAYRSSFPSIRAPSRSAEPPSS